MSQPSISSKKRLVFIFVSVCLAMLGLIIRLGWIQIVQGERYKELANAQQTRDIPIPSKRGTIYDRNGKELAISASTNTVWARPREIEDAKIAAELLGEILQLDVEETIEKLEDTTYGLVRIARWIEDDLAEAIRSKRIKGVWIAEDNKRFYPYGNFAAYILGHTTDDNRGMAGIELEYEKYLSGLPGRWIKNTDGAGRQLAFSVERYYPPEDGLNLVLTIDEVIQHFAEKAVENALIMNQAKRATAIVMDIKTGDVLAMAIKPDYDPNDPRTPLDDVLREQIEAMDNEKKLEAWFSMWRNPAINDTYEPGSTFKILTAAAALEEAVANPNSQFHCTGTITVGGRTIKCWRYYNPHGAQTFTEAVQNSCNPVFVELGQKMGVETFYNYLDGFGVADVTGIDLPGERKSIMYNVNNVGPVELATISFGQSISITPIQLITAVSAIANDGNLMKPRIVKELLDHEGKVVHRFEETMVRQVISSKTSKEIRDIMESVVTEGSGKSAYIPGYSVGGKTGTAQKVVDGRYAQGIYVSSFIGIAPSDDPRLAVLAIVDEPGGYSHFGSVVAAPIAREILEESLRYLDIKPKYTDEEAEALIHREVVIPEVRGLTVKEASQILTQSKLEHATWPEYIGDGENIVTDMFPKPSARVPEKSIIMLYTKHNENIPSSIVLPDLKGKTIREANAILNSLGLKLKITGSGLADMQTPEAGAEVDPGTIVTVEFKPN
ncbi:stage V sporulation protein D (sporulation-specific penicillin-binding protein) [Natronincola peptidivorans]|uniref:Stage V sporulation protein D (Sporulation-specific penicillin-binding protein) n=1 Tax=Natronincola peptidivorans TaxID=426128 RepID=A0A1H9Y836_9FIRM|nr:stage V sporulation protein D [Natronincola peptidivorans]SES64541.1 stage V sporulation protein D (sporulation-specific penicillin-binding protein) [Natronincola peptidivorans]